jgi:hypothetical protein
MNRQGLLAVWIMIGAILIGTVLATQDGADTLPDAAATADADSTTTSVVADATTTTPPSTVTTAEPTTTTTVAPDQRLLPTTPAELATALSEAETMVRTADDPAPWGRRQQQLYRLLSANRDWAQEAIAGVDESVQSAVERNWAARQNLSALVTSVSLSTVLPAWSIRAPLPADELIELYRDAEAQTSIPWEYLAAINLVETRMGRIEGLSAAGATGPMQFLPSTFAECCEGDPTLDRDAIIGAGVYLAIRGGPDDMPRALRGYNNSSRYVDAVTAYAEVLEADPAAYFGYHAWDVYFLSAAGLVRMPVGYNESEPVDAATWIAANPQAIID